MGWLKRREFRSSCPECGSASNWDPLALHAQPLAADHLSGLLVGPDWTPTEFGDFDAFTNACRALGAERDGSQLDADPQPCVRACAATTLKTAVSATVNRL